MSEPRGRFFVNKWYTFSACAALQLSAGLAYTFTIFSADLKETFQWSQTELTGFSTALNLGAFSAFIPGLIYNRLYAFPRAGPRFCLLLAAALAAIGMGLIWATAIQRISLSYPALLLAAFAFSNSNAFMDITSVTCNIENWPNDRGMAVGVMKAAVGLSGSVYGTVYAALLPDVHSYLLFMTVVPAASALLAMPWVNRVPWIQRSELVPYGLLTTASRFLMSYQVLFLIAVFNVLASMEVHKHASDSTRVLLVAVLTALVLSLFLTTIYTGGVRSKPAHIHLDTFPEHPLERRLPASVLSHPLRLPLDDWMSMLRSQESAPRDAAPLDARTYVVDGGESMDLDDSVHRPLAPRRGSTMSQQPLGRLGSGDVSSIHSDTSIASELYHEQPAEDVPPHQTVCTIEFHLLVFCCFVGMGSGLALIDNLPQLLVSLAPRGAQLPRLLPNNLLIVFALCNTLGRILSGYTSERALHVHIQVDVGVQQIAAAFLLWLRTQWIYDRMAAHLREVEDNIVEEGSDAFTEAAAYSDDAGHSAAGRPPFLRHSRELSSSAST